MMQYGWFMNSKTKIFLVFVNLIDSIVRVTHVFFDGGHKQDSFS